MNLANNVSKPILDTLNSKLGKNVSELNQEEISDIDEYLINYLNNIEIKWDPSTPCGSEGSTEGFLGTMRSLFHYESLKFWILFFVSITILLLVPTFYKLSSREYTHENWDQKSSGDLFKKFIFNIALSPEDVSLTLINIILFTIVSISIFYFVMSKDVYRIVENNLEVYLGFVKKDPVRKQKFLDAVNKKIKDNKKTFDEYEAWKNKCNKKYLKRSYVYTTLILVILFAFLGIQRFKFPHYKFQFNSIFILSAVLIMMVFTTELYMVNFVFTKINIVGEIEIIYNVLNKMSQKMTSS